MFAGRVREAFSYIVHVPRIFAALVSGYMYMCMCMYESMFASLNFEAGFQFRLAAGCVCEQQARK